MNSSIYSADRATYLRIVVVALMVSIGIVGFAISARVSAFRSLQAANVGQVERAEFSGRKAALASPVRPNAPI